ncbi:MAG: sulfatase-like hydrolase/transferase [Pirellulales bacterium]|nr:sulfatase-like hydrolase/transferase [Pirellulales bacterium]
MSTANEDTLHTKSNILLILTDQQAATALSCTGNADLETPGLDKLAASGTRFDRAYVTQPLCLPCRSSLQTSRFPHEIGAVNNGRKIRGAFPMLGKLMSEAGYHCAYLGKWHVGTSFKKAGYVEADKVGLDPAKTEAALAFLRRKHTKPFFLTVSFMNPHNVCELARGQNLPDGPIGQPPTELSKLPPLPANFDVPRDEPSLIRAMQKKEPKYYPTADWDELKWRQYLWGYYRLVEKVDRQIGQVLDVLDEAGLADNTVVLFTSDHGEGVAAHRWNQKQVLYDQTTRVPMLFRVPGGPKGRVSAELVSTALDIPVTILDFAGVKQPSSMRGLSWRPVIEGEKIKMPRKHVVAETMFTYGKNKPGGTGRMVRTDRYKYCVYSSGQHREQLFDMQTDPGETRNLAPDPAHHEILNRHRRLLLDWAKETRDEGFPHVSPDED